MLVIHHPVFLVSIFWQLTNSNIPILIPRNSEDDNNSEYNTVDSRWKELRILKLYILRNTLYQVSYFNQFRSTSLRKNARFSLPPGSNNGGTDLEKATGNNHLDDEVDSRTPLTTTSSQNKATANHHHSSLAERIRDKIQVGKKQLHI